MHPQLKRLVCASFLAAATAVSDAQAHGPDGYPYGYGHPSHRYGGGLPPHQTFLPQVFGPYGLLGQRGPLSPGARLGRVFDPRFSPSPMMVPNNYGNPFFRPQQQLGGGAGGAGNLHPAPQAPPPGMCNLNNDSRYPNWYPCAALTGKQKGGYVTGPDGTTNYIFPLPPGQ